MADAVEGFPEIGGVFPIDIDFDDLANADVLQAGKAETAHGVANGRSLRIEDVFLRCDEYGYFHDRKEVSDPNKPFTVKGKLSKSKRSKISWGQRCGRGDYRGLPRSWKDPPAPPGQPISNRFHDPHRLTPRLRAASRGGDPGRLHEFTDSTTGSFY